MAVTRSASVRDEPLGPPRTGPPGRALEHEAGPVLAGEREVRLVVLLERPRAVRVAEQRERGELGKVDAPLEDEDRLETAVGEHEAVAEVKRVLS